METPISWAVIVLLKGEADYARNDLRYATSDEAQSAGKGLKRRWGRVMKFEVVVRYEPVNATVVNGMGCMIPELAQEKIRVLRGKEKTNENQKSSSA